jgi:hypothetical protein
MMNQSAKARMRRECKEYLVPFGIPVNEYNAGEIYGGPYRWEVNFKHKRTGAEIIVSNIFVSDSGEVIQSGAHAGALEF